MAVVETRAPKLTAPAYIGKDTLIRGVSGIHLPLTARRSTWISQLSLIEHMDRWCR
jgi:hypothetical protein